MEDSKVTGNVPVKGISGPQPLHFLFLPPGDHAVSNALKQTPYNRAKWPWTGAPETFSQNKGVAPLNSLILAI